MEVSVLNGHEKSLRAAGGGGPWVNYSKGIKKVDGLSLTMMISMISNSCWLQRSQGRGVSEE